MASLPVDWPEKTREIATPAIDSARWNRFSYRPGDIIIATPGKTGTTWVQQIVAQLVFDGKDVPVGELSPWLEYKGTPIEKLLQGLDAQTNRRFIKTHLPVDALGIRAEIKYIFIGRDGRDIAFSAFEHSLRSMPEGAFPFADVRSFFLGSLAGLLGPSNRGPRESLIPPVLPTVQGWWNARHLPNVLLVHYARLKSDMAGEIRRIAAFLDIEPNKEAWPKIIEHCAFDYMKRNAASVGPKGNLGLRGGAAAFFHAGVNGRWRDALSAEDIAKYEQLVADTLTPDCAHWLATGELPEGED